MLWIVELFISFVIPIFAHMQPLCVGGRKDLDHQCQCTKLPVLIFLKSLIIAYPKHFQKRLGGGGVQGHVPLEKILKNRCYL